MLQSLICLEDDEIDTVLDAVSAYCASQGVPVESEAGQEAVSVAIDIANGGTTVDILSEIKARLDRQHS